MAINASVYILECADGSFYVGSTIDLERRLWQHQHGEGAAYTRRRGRRPVTLVYVEHFDQISDAFLREKQIQNWGRTKRIALIEARYADLPELAKGLTDVVGFVPRRRNRDVVVSTSSTTEGSGLATEGLGSDVGGGVSTSSTTEGSGSGDGGGVSTSSTTEGLGSTTEGAGSTTEGLGSTTEPSTAGG